MCATAQHLLKLPYFQEVEAEADRLTSMSLKLEESMAEVAAWAEEEGVSKERRFKKETDVAFQAITNAVGYDARHWDTPNGVCRPARL